MPIFAHYRSDGSVDHYLPLAKSFPEVVNPSGGLNLARFLFSSFDGVEAMRLYGSALAAICLLLANPTSAHAVTTVLTATLSGTNEVPARVTPATGIATVTFDDVTNILSIQTTFSGLLGNTVAAHLHCCSAPTGTAPVATTVPAFAGFPLGVTSGSYSGLLNLTQASSFNPAYITANGGNIDTARRVLVGGLLSNQAYLNIHSSVFPGGEIRGQLISAVPEPATWAMLLMGFGMIGYSARRGRRVLAYAT